MTTCIFNVSVSILVSTLSGKSQVEWQGVPLPTHEVGRWLEASPGPGRVAVNPFHACFLLPVHVNSLLFPPEFSTHSLSLLELETLSVQTSVATAVSLLYNDCLGPNPLLLKSLSLSVPPFPHL